MKLFSLFLLIAFSVRASVNTIEHTNYDENSALLQVDPPSSSHGDNAKFNKSSRKSKWLVSAICVVLAASAVPVFVTLSWSGVLKLYPATALAATITVLCAIATANQFIYPAWLFGQRIHDFFSSDQLKFSRIFVGLIELIIATFANIPLLYLNHIAFSGYVGEFIYVWDALCMIGGNIVWIWAIDSYVRKFGLFVIECKRPEIKATLIAVDRLRCYIQALEASDQNGDLSSILQNFPSVRSKDFNFDSLDLPALPASYHPKPSLKYLKYFGGAIGGIIGALGSVVYYNLGINASLTCLQWMNITEQHAVFAITHIAGAFGVLTAGAFNSIAGASVVSSWFQNAGSIKELLKSFSLSTFFGSLIQLLIVGALAFGASVPQLELTFRNVGQDSIFSTAVDILSLLSGFFAAYWPSKELLHSMTQRFSCRRDENFKFDEKKETILSLLNEVENIVIDRY